jgi:exodeoxyribonuclease-3
MRLISWNVNGLRAIQKKGFEASWKKMKPDILCLQETKASEDQLPEGLVHPRAYHATFSSGLKKGYSGVAIYSKHEPHSIATGMGIEEFDTEGRLIIADYGEFVLANVYFPNGGASPERLRYKLRFYEAFLDFADMLVKKKKRHVVICGDVNTAHQAIDLARPRENEKNTGFLPEERAWIDNLVEHGFVDTFRQFHSEGGNYSWWDYKTHARERNVGWRIDYFFVNSAFTKRITSAFILPDIDGSDHCPVGIDLA